MKLTIQNRQAQVLGLKDPRQGGRDSPAAGWVALPLPAEALGGVLFRELTSGEASPRKILGEKAVARELLLQRH